MKQFYKKLLFLLFLFSGMNAGAHTLNGVVTDASNKAITNATVLNLSNQQSVQTDKLGDFILVNVHLGDSLRISADGYETRSIHLDNESYFQADYTFILYDKTMMLDEIEVTADKPLITTASNIDLKLQPVRSTQELLTLVPGLFIAQHAGGGKAEQLFLRGFDLDHGTDIALSLDGMPVNMVSHAHGQGYSDMHFIMPEVVEKIDFGKGPYDVNKGNFATAGYVDFQTRDKLQNNFVSAEYGMFDYRRLTAGVNVLNKTNQSAYVAADYMQTNNYFVAPQDFTRINLFGKYTGTVSPNCRISLTASTFHSKWNASGQIPDRAVADGSISFFGAIDSTEGGVTGRSNLQLEVVNKLHSRGVLKSNFFVSDYDFSLYSNFTFFLNDSIHGDQINQFEHRRIYGASTEWSKSILTKKDNKISFKAGVGFRYDDIGNIGLTHTQQRLTIIDTVQLGSVSETNIYAYASMEYAKKRWLFNLGIRGDNVSMYYANRLDSLFNPKTVQATVPLPKLNITWSATEKLQLYYKAGVGYHSNDTRVLLGNDNLRKKVLPLAYGSDIGFGWKPFKSLLINAATFYLFSEQEFVYVGDVGIVEPSGRTQRLGFDGNITFQPFAWLFMYSNINYAHARTVDDPAGQNYVPLAPVWTSNGKIQVNLKKGFFTSLGYRYMGDRAANADNSVIAKGYFVNDFTIGYQYKNVVLTGIINNVFNVRWKETQFLTESRLKNETQPVEEIHFTPGTPFSFRMQVKVLF